LEITGGTGLEWSDFDFTNDIGPKANYGDAERTGLDFLSASDPVRQGWSRWWPQTGNVQNWDAVGKLTIDGREEWILLEAKANTQELETECGAKERGGLPQIRQCLAECRQAMGITGELDWFRPYYQYANRLAVLHFLALHGIDARLLFVYFTGDKIPNRNCPSSIEGWEPILKTMKAALGLTGKSHIEQRIYELFLPAVEHARGLPSPDLQKS
jgi:hypothetical protein